MVFPHHLIQGLTLDQCFVLRSWLKTTISLQLFIFPKGRETTHDFTQIWFCGVQMWCHLHDRNQPPEWKLQATNDRVFTSTDLTKGIQLWKPWVFQEHLWFHDLQHNCWVVPHFRMQVMIRFLCIFRLGDPELPLTITRKDTATQTYGYDVI